MKHISQVILLLFVLLFTASLGISLYTIISLTQVNLTSSSDIEQADRHYGIFLPDNSYAFFHDVTAGAKRAGSEISCGLSFHSIDDELPDLRLAKYSGIDGAIIYPSIREESAREILTDLVTSSIPVVLIEHAIADDSPWPFVGTNNFDLGKQIGRLIGDTGANTIHAAIVYSEKSPGIFAERELVEMGILTVLNQRLGSPLRVLKSDMNPFAAEDLTNRILRNEPEVNTIIYTDTNDTLAATQVIVDMNLVGKVQIIGFGSDEPVLEYIEKGIISGSVVVNPDQIGYRAVRLLDELVTEGMSESYIDTGVQIITRGYLEEIR